MENTQAMYYGSMTIEVFKNNRKFQFIVQNDAPFDDIEEVIYDLKRCVAEIKQRTISQQQPAQEAQPPKEGEPV